MLRKQIVGGAAAHFFSPRSRSYSKNWLCVYARPSGAIRRSIRVRARCCDASRRFSLEPRVLLTEDRGIRRRKRQRLMTVAMIERMLLMLKMHVLRWYHQSSHAANQ